jgi:hypothetical protein
MKWLALLIVALALALAAACGDDGGGASPTASGGMTPAGTKDETPTAAATNGGEAPDPTEPTLDEQLTEITSGDMEQTIDPGAGWELVPADITETDTGEAPVCTNFAFDFTWQVQDPFPPDSVDLRWQLTRDESTVEVSSGPDGEQTVGCGLLTGENHSAFPITVALRYRVGSIQ